mmetsp:Transcript_56771/g.112742  ORF Transcript_56771/g.112742 Transcript_56771/m.112742 type:complete len:265 (-) Transcript_56771:473-1267(-)
MRARSVGRCSVDRTAKGSAARRRGWLFASWARLQEGQEVGASAGLRTAAGSKSCPHHRHHCCCCPRQRSCCYCPSCCCQRSHPLHCCMRRCSSSPRGWLCTSTSPQYRRESQRSYAQVTAGGQVTRNRATRGVARRPARLVMHAERWRQPIRPLPAARPGRERGRGGGWEAEGAASRKGERKRGRCGEVTRWVVSGGEEGTAAAPPGRACSAVQVRREAGRGPHGLGRGGAPTRRTWRHSRRRRCTRVLPIRGHPMARDQKAGR